MSGYKKYKNNTRGWDTPVYHEIYVLFFTTGYSVYLDVQSFIMELRTQTFEIQPLYYQAWVHTANFIRERISFTEVTVF